MEKSWEDSLHKNIKEMKSEINLRNDFERIHVSTLSSQLYCEKKVEYDIEFQPEDTETQITGTVIHDSFIPVEEITIEELISNVKSGSRVVSIFHVFLKIGDVLISGIHDGVVFNNGKLKYLFEIKTTKNPRNLLKIWPGERLQSIIYALSLEYMGFDISSLKIVIPKAMQSIEKSSIIDPLLNYLDNKSNELESLYGEEIKIHSFTLTKKRREDAINELGKLIKYWKNEREALFSGNYNKCKYCDYKDICQYAKGKL